MTANTPHIHSGLMNQIACGDKDALAQLYRTLSPRLFGIILRMVRRRDWAEEILHDTFIQIWQSAMYYDEQRSEPQIWLSHIARNRAIDYLRKHEHRCCSVEEISEADEGFQAPLPSEDVHLEARRLQHCMENLPVEQRQSIALAYYRGLSQTEIALSMSQPEGTVKSWIRRALTHLRECIGL
ncbi:RNA polymerase subunit sigma [Serratia plymuthica]|uniref:sigma-70 family RNA polymerase sigma factor n=1 Tax=Serratia plymuthica TaxID=82996 RepID=UPI00059DBCF9|nr:sigma-70 family RNA polymerase sigma factor [Serratia plymuthica]KYG14266.1 ECF RNA polymerase sigma factor SigK [Serratia plymuthica]KYQ96154.1 RNA polymerase subunit sigma [Serratia plymuthica]NIC27563.1 sigma-70 family RNA polymerase sigma factor [Serratia plymuthica]QPS88179.1 sigma-70 family RNA polymerase sigma factor [Serratia plymuthica]QQT81243.1 sigma-70 family RNA polymerase sigma factor [Serratia plymuthica]